MTDRIVCYRLEGCEAARDTALWEDRRSPNERIEGLDERDRNLHLLLLLGEVPNAEVSFQGLKRKLGWHQEILSRTLKRMEKDRLLSKTPSGAYRLNAKLSPSPPSSGTLRDDVTPVTQLWLPNDLDPDAIASDLRGSWFGKWRWYSYRETDSELVLTWISEDGSVSVGLRIVGEVVLIEAGPAGSVGRDRCIHAGYDLLGHILRRYKSVLSEPKGMLQAN